MFINLCQGNDRIFTHPSWERGSSSKLAAEQALQRSSTRVRGGEVQQAKPGPAPPPTPDPVAPHGLFEPACSIQVYARQNVPGEEGGIIPTPGEPRPEPGSGFCEPVSDAGLGEDVGGVPGIVTELLA